jgi:hypothetical protein
MAAAEVETLLMAYAETGDPPPPREVDTVPTDVPLPPEEPRGRGGARRTLAAVAAVTLLAVGAGALAAVLVVRHDEGDRATASTPPGTAVTTRPSTTPPTTPHTTPAVPSGFERIEDPNGFTVELPAGYTRQYVAPRTYYWSPDRTIRFGVRHQVPDPRGPYAVMRDQDLAGAKPHSAYPGYRDGIITRTTQHGQPAALWEFTYNGFSDGTGDRRTFDLCWTENGRMYDMWLSAPTTLVEEARHDFDIARASFQGR